MRVMQPISWIGAAPVSRRDPGSVDRLGRAATRAPHCPCFSATNRPQPTVQHTAQPTGEHPALSSLHCLALRTAGAQPVLSDAEEARQQPERCQASARGKPRCAGAQGQAVHLRCDVLRRAAAALGAAVAVLVLGEAKVRRASPLRPSPEACTARWSLGDDQEQEPSPTVCSQPVRVWKLAWWHAIRDVTRES